MRESLIPAPVRFFHWSIALLIVLNLYVFEHGKNYHQYAGYAGFGLVVMRVLFGQFFHQKKFSFSRFEFRISELISFLKDLVRGESQDFKGHNPMASYVYISIWAIVCLLATSGFLMKEVDAFWGNETIEVAHKVMTLFLIGLIILHLTGILHDSLLFKRKTWKRMFTGKDF